MVDTELMNLLMGLAYPISIGGVFLYIRGIKMDVRDLGMDVKTSAKDLSEFKNGHYKLHMDEAYRKGLLEGTTKKTLEALHNRLDRLVKEK